MLRVEKLSGGYGGVEILSDISLEVKEKETLAIIGANGSGKTTLLRAISGLISCSSGNIYFNGNDITRLAPHKRVSLGIIQVAEGHSIFRQHTVRKNLLLGAYFHYNRLEKAERERLLNFCFELFPVLCGRLNQIAATLSGGEQQMLAIAKGLMGKPKIMLFDEPSLGLAPILIKNVGSTLLTLRGKGLTILLAEQNVTLALELANRICIFENGRIASQGMADEILDEESVRRFYLGGL